MKRWLRRAALAGGVLLTLAALVVVTGIVPVRASSGHWPVTAFLLHFALQRSVATHSIGIPVPPLDDPRLVRMGAGHYHGGCAPCHAAPGERVPRIPQAMTPAPPDLSERAGEYDDAELFYIVKHGVKFTGMPAWPAQGRDDEVWAVVAFVRRLATMDRDEYLALVAPERPPVAGAPEIVIARCARCHGADGLGEAPDGRGEGAFPSLAGQRDGYLRGALRAYAHGDRHSGIMEPIARGLEHGEIDTIAAWYSSRAPLMPRASEPSGRGAEIAQRGILERRIPACADCHAREREPAHPGYPVLAGQYPEYLVQQLELWTRGERGGSELAEIMQTVAAHGLRPDEIRAVSQYYASVSSGR